MPLNNKRLQNGKEEITERGQSRDEVIANLKCLTDCCVCACTYTFLEMLDKGKQC